MKKLIILCIGVLFSFCTPMFKHDVQDTNSRIIVTEINTLSRYYSTYELSFLSGSVLYGTIILEDTVGKYQIGQALLFKVKPIEQP